MAAAQAQAMAAGSPADSEVEELAERYLQELWKLEQENSRTEEPPSVALAAPLAKGGAQEGGSAAARAKKSGGNAAVSGKRGAGSFRALEMDLDDLR